MNESSYSMCSKVKPTIFFSHFIFFVVFSVFLSESVKFSVKISTPIFILEEDEEVGKVDIYELKAAFEIFMEILRHFNDVNIKEI